MATSNTDVVSRYSSVAMSQKAGHDPRDESEAGWVRTVHAYVQYNASGGLPYSWQRIEPQKYFLGQDEQTVKNTRSLGEIAERLAHQRNSGAGPSDESLQELDSIAWELLTTTRRLHGEQRQLAVITRDNVVWTGRKILLMDQGFHVPSGVLIPPPWIGAPPPDSLLWEDSILKQQNKALPDPKFAPAEDVRLLIWLYQGLLLNVWQPSLARGPELRNVYKTQSMDLWDRFRKLTDPPSPRDLDDLEAVLQAHPISTHFRSVGGGGVGKKRRTRFGALLLLPALLAAGLATSWQLRTWPFSLPAVIVPPQGPTAGVPGSDKTGEKKAPANLPDLPALIEEPDSMVAQIKSLEGQADSLKSLNDRLESTMSQVADEDRPAVDAYRERFLEQWSVSFPSALKTLRQETTRAEGFETLTALRDHLLKVRQLTRIPPNDKVKIKERQCLELLQTLRFDSRLPEAFRRSLSFSPSADT